MEVVQVLHMNGGLGDSSYANNSLVQRKVILMTKPITEEAITQLHTAMHHPNNNLIRIADLGCSSGPNTFFVVGNLVRTVDKLCRKLGHNSPEFQISLNDLPGNDFNSIFQSLLPRFQEELRQETRPEGSGTCFVSGVPGSFYGRLFPANSLHFVHSSYSLMWLSKVPEGVERNKENIYMASSSPRSVIDAYYRQFQSDFSTFLKCRSEEVISGGKMVLTILGRKSEDPWSKDGCYIWELLAVALQQMVSKVIITHMYLILILRSIDNLVRSKLMSHIRRIRGIGKHIPKYMCSPCWEVSKDKTVRVQPKPENIILMPELWWQLQSLNLANSICGGGVCVQGRIEEEKLHSFNIPQYTPSPKEVAEEVGKQGSFTIDRLVASEITWAACCSGNGMESSAAGYDVAKCMRSVAESLLIQHFGDQSVMDELFETYREVISDRISKENPKFINVTVSMTRQ